MPEDTQSKSVKNGNPNKEDNQHLKPSACHIGNSNSLLEESIYKDILTKKLITKKLFSDKSVSDNMIENLVKNEDEANKGAAEDLEKRQI